MPRHRLPPLHATAAPLIFFFLFYTMLKATNCPHSAVPDCVLFLFSTEILPIIPQFHSSWPPLAYVKLDHVVNAEDGNGSLRGELDALNLANGRLQHTGLAVVPHYALGQVKTNPRWRLEKGDRRGEQVRHWLGC